MLLETGIYSFDEKLSSNGPNTVWKGKRNSDQKPVAIKIMDKTQMEESEKFHLACQKHALKKLKSQKIIEV